MPSEKDRAAATKDMHKIFGEVRSCGLRVYVSGQTDRQTDRHTHYNTSHHSRTQPELQHRRFTPCNNMSGERRLCKEQNCSPGISLYVSPSCPYNAARRLHAPVGLQTDTPGEIMSEVQTIVIGDWARCWLDPPPAIASHPCSILSSVSGCETVLCRSQSRSEYG